MAITRTRRDPVSNTTVLAAAAFPETDWGKQPRFDDVRAFHQYNRFLRRGVLVGELLVCALVVVTVSTFLGFLYSGNFENLIFWDGTDHACILDGNTGQIDSVN
jgi:hypothetical protein